MTIKFFTNDLLDRAESLFDSTTGLQEVAVLNFGEN